MAEIFLIAGMALVTFSIRYVMFAVAGRVVFPGWLLQALRYVPAAVLTAIITPAVFIPGGQHLDLSLDNAYLVGAIAATIIGWYKQNLLLTIVVGMLVFWGWQWLLLA